MTAQEEMSTATYKIVYCTPALYSAGGVERIVSVKANYFADVLGYDVTIIVTEGRGRDSFFPLSEKVKVINLELGFEQLWRASFLKKIWLYLNKQRIFKKRLTAELLRIRPDFTISMLRREINFLTAIPDGSKKIGELHVNRANYRNFEANESNLFKRLFAKYWMHSLVKQLASLDRLVVLTDKSKAAWPELQHVTVIPDPLPFHPKDISEEHAKRVVTIGRYAYQKGYDLLLQAWKMVEQQCPDWHLDIYGMGDRRSMVELMTTLGLDTARCHLHGAVSDVQQVYRDSSLFVLSSRFEGFGLVLIEAMACGVPVVAFNCPLGPDEIITDGEDGCLVASGDVEALAVKMVSMMRDKALRQQYAQQAQQRAERYDIEKIARQWMQLFSQLKGDEEV